MTQPPIVTHRLTKTFGPARGVIEADLLVPEGQVFGFLGPNGAGKTTTIRCLLGLYRPDRGRALVLGSDPAGADATYRRQVGYLPGELHLPESLTGADVLDRFGRLRGMREGRDTAYRDALVERFGAQLDRPVRVLSKGNKQKLGLVLAFMHRPRLLVLDEPTSGLDPLLREEFATLLGETVADGRTVLLSSHDLDEVAQVAHRVAIIRAGRIVVDDTVEALRASAPRRIELTFDRDLGPDDPGVAALGRVPGVTVDSSGPRRIALSHNGSAAPILAAVAALRPEAIVARPARLDELFLRLYRDGGEPGDRWEHDRAS